MCAPRVPCTSVYVCVQARVCTASSMSHIFSINCQKSNQNRHVCVRVHAHLRTCARGYFCWDDTYTGTCVNIYVHTFTHSPFTAGVDVDCVARVSDPSMVDVAKIGCFWRVEKRL